MVSSADFNHSRIGNGHLLAKEDKHPTNKTPISNVTTKLLDSLVINDDHPIDNRNSTNIYIWIFLAVVVSAILIAFSIYCWLKFRRNKNRGVLAQPPTTTRDQGDCSKSIKEPTLTEPTQTSSSSQASPAAKTGISDLLFLESDLMKVDELGLLGFLMLLRADLSRQKQNSSLECGLMEDGLLPKLLKLLAKRKLSVETLQVLLDCLNTIVRTNGTDQINADINAATVERLKIMFTSTVILFPAFVALLAKTQPYLNGVTRLVSFRGAKPLAWAAMFWMRTVPFSEDKDERKRQLDTWNTIITAQRDIMLERPQSDYAQGERAHIVGFFLAALEKVLEAMEKHKKDIKRNQWYQDMKMVLKSVVHAISAISNDQETCADLVAEPTLRLVKCLLKIVQLQLLTEMKIGNVEMNFHQIILKIMVNITKTETGAAQSIILWGDIIKPSLTDENEEIRKLAAEINDNKKKNFHINKK